MSAVKPLPPTPPPPGPLPDLLASPHPGGGEEERARFPFVDLRTVELHRDISRLLPEKAARSVDGVCFGTEGDDGLLVAVTDPTSVYIYDHVNYSTGGRFRAILHRADPDLVELAREFVYIEGPMAARTDWRPWLERHRLDKAELVVANPMADMSVWGDDITSPVIKMVDRLVKEAISSGASDLHLETFRDYMEVRYRIDGVLHHVATFPADQTSPMVKRVKVMANMDIAQERLPQGGRISLRVGDDQYDLRVSVVPVPSGESVVMRVLRKGAFNLTLADLGFPPDLEEAFRRIVSEPYGLVLVCGPTGSGKSTTLYASLKELHRPDRKLLTVEDPIEYEMPGIVQVQVDMAHREAEKRVTFARILREFLRQDPDVILVGEIRDPETAEVALQASLTGHLVLSTVHTNDSLGIIPRLREMGLESFLVGSTLLGGLAQRLARRICLSCREEVEIPPGYREDFTAVGVEEPRLFHGRGCPECNGTGTRGRIGIYELMEVGDDLRALITRDAPETELLEALRARGFRTLRENALRLAAQGVVSLVEVERVTRSL